MSVVKTLLEFYDENAGSDDVWDVVRENFDLDIMPGLAGLGALDRRQTIALYDFAYQKLHNCRPVIRPEFGIGWRRWPKLAVLA